MEESTAAEIVAAVEQAGVQSAAGFNYRNAPAVQAARAMIADGRLGTITHARFRLFSDYAAHPDGADGLNFHADVTIAPYSVLVYSQQP